MILSALRPHTAALFLLAILWVPLSVSSAPQSEGGILTRNQPAANTWHPVTFARGFPAAPVVVLGPASQNDAQPTTLRVRNVTATGFEFQIDEWDYLDGIHAAESLSYLALEPGVHSIGGQKWEAGRVTAVTRQLRTVNLTGGFSGAPVVLPQVESINNPQALAVRVQSVSSTSFGIFLQTQEAYTAAIVGESVAYLAVAPGVSEMNGAPLIAARTGANMTDRPRAILVGPHYRNPLVFAQSQTNVGTDPITVRQRLVQLNHGLYVPSGGYYTNTRGGQEKYLNGALSANGYNQSDGYWYYILPNGDLFEFTPPYSNPALTGALVARLGAAFYTDPALLTEGLTRPDPNYYLNYRGQQEKYLRANTSASGYVDAGGYWYYLLSNGALHEFRPPYSNPALGGVVIAQLGPVFYNQPALLTSGLSIPSGGYYTNSRGQQEKYLRGNLSASGYNDPAGYWYYLLPNGALYEFTPPYTNPALTGALMTQLDAAYYQDPTLLTAASLAKAGFEISLQEEQSLETDTVHPAEDVGYLLLSGKVDSGGGPAVIGQWGGAFTWGMNGGLNALHMMVLPDKRVISWPVSKSASEPQVWTPDAGFILAPVPSSVYRQSEDDVFCSGHVVLPSGRLLVNGGQQSVNGLGIPTSFLFDFATNIWTRSGDMGGVGREGRRWYPTTIALPSGAALTVSGSADGSIYDQSSLIVNNRPEVYSGGVWSPLNAAPEGQGYDVFYPWLHVAPNGRAFYSGPQPATRYLNPLNGDLAPVDATEFGQHRYWGTSVMYEPGKVLIVGGTTAHFYSDATALPTNSAEVIDLNQPSPAWRNTRTAMARGRKHHNAVILPDGKVLIVGGTSCAPWHSVLEDGSGNVVVPELWNPASEEFTPMAPLTARVDASLTARLRTRAYHSTAVLLADGRVLVAAGEWASHEPPSGEAPADEPAHEDAQIFQPPYLFNADGTAAARPAISAPAERSSFAYNARIDITTNPNQAPSISEVNLVGLSSVTHGFNMGQRFVRLRFTGDRTSSTLSVLTPASANECPPGFYLLFILQRNPLNNERLVPSQARVIRVQ